MPRKDRKAAKKRKVKKALAIIVARSLVRQLAQAPPGRRGRCGRPAVAGSLGAGSVGALALGALSLGAGAVGALAIGRLAIRRGTVGSLRIEELKVGRLEVQKLSVLNRTAG